MSECNLCTLERLQKKYGKKNLVYEPDMGGTSVLKKEEDGTLTMLAWLMEIPKSCCCD